MKQLRARDVGNLPDQIKTLISDGVYSLYTSKHEDVDFVLVTKAGEFYCLSAAGDIKQVAGIRDLKDAEVDEAVMLVDVPADEALAINYA